LNLSTELGFGFEKVDITSIVAKLGRLEDQNWFLTEGFLSRMQMQEEAEERFESKRHLQAGTDARHWRCGLPFMKTVGRAVKGTYKYDGLRTD